LIPMFETDASDFNMTGVTNFTGNAKVDAIIGGLSSVFKGFLASANKPLTKSEFADYVSDFALYYVYIGLVVFVASFVQVCTQYTSYLNF